MYSLRIVYDVDGWAWHRQARCLQKFAAADVDVSLAAAVDHATATERLGDTEPDIVLVFGSGITRQLRSEIDRRGWATKLVVRWTTGWPDRLPRLATIRELADLIVFNNKDYWHRAGRLPGTSYVSNGVDLDDFRIVRPIETRSPKVLWCGSMLNREHKRYDDLIVPLRDALADRSIDCDLLLVDSFGPGKRTTPEMVEWYNGGTVVVCASKSEGTPNVALEGAACGCTVVSAAVGNMPELIRHRQNGYLVEPTLDAFLDGVQQAIDDYPRLARSMQDDILSWSWKARAAEMYEMLRQAAAPQERKTAIERWGRPDLSGELTVVVDSAGGRDLGAALRHLQDQDCAVRIEIVDGRDGTALCDRLLRCGTPYVAIVPSSVHLDTNAMSFLFEAMEKSDKDVVAFTAPLRGENDAADNADITLYRKAAMAAPRSADGSSDRDEIIALLRRRSPPDPITRAMFSQWDPSSTFGRDVGQGPDCQRVSKRRSTCALDLRSELTVFVSTVGAPTFRECLARIRDQDCDFRLEIIDRVAPHSTALQSMVDRCETPYYIQLDEDMLLRRHAARHLYEAIKDLDPDVAIYVGRLYDAHLQRHIFGVTIKKHDIMREFPYVSLDYSRLPSLTEKGFKIVRAPIEGATFDSPETVGLHGTAWTARSIFERYATLHRWRRDRTKAPAWLKECPTTLMENFFADPSPVNFHALMGMITGVLARHQGPSGKDEPNGNGYLASEDREKDFRRYHDLVGLAESGALYRAAAPSDGEASAFRLDDVVEFLAPGEN